MPNTVMNVNVILQVTTAATALKNGANIPSNAQEKNVAMNLMVTTIVSILKNARQSQSVVLHAIKNAATLMGS